MGVWLAPILSRLLQFIREQSGALCLFLCFQYSFPFLEVIIFLLSLPYLLLIFPSSSEPSFHTHSQLFTGWVDNQSHFLPKESSHFINSLSPQLSSYMAKCVTLLVQIHHCIAKLESMGL